MHVAIYGSDIVQVKGEGSKLLLTKPKKTTVMSWKNGCSTYLPQNLHRHGLTLCLGVSN